MDVLKDLTRLTVWEGLVWEGTLRSKVMAWWLEMEGSNFEILDTKVSINQSFIYFKCNKSSMNSVRQNIKFK